MELDRPPYGVEEGRRHSYRGERFFRWGRGLSHPMSPKERYFFVFAREINTERMGAGSYPILLCNMKFYKIPRNARIKD